MSGSVDVHTDLPGASRSLAVYLTTQRILCLSVLDRTPKLVWWTWLDQIARVDVQVRWQNRVLNRGKETIVTLHSTDGRTIVCGHNHVVDGRRATARYAEALQRNVGSSPPASWGSAR